MIALYRNIIQYTEISCSEILVICSQWGCGGVRLNFVVPTLFRRHIILFHFAGHKAEKNTSFDTITCCWDVDRLDIRRVGLELDLQWFNTEAVGYMIINKDFRRIDK